MKMHARCAIRSSEKSAISCSRSNPGHIHSAHCYRRRFSCILFLVALASSTLPRYSASATTGRFWTYLNVTALVSPSWSLVTMPGFRYEFARTEETMICSNRGFYFYEFLIGPTHAHTWGRFSLKLPLWYYYMGFPSPDEHDYSHNIEFLPILNCRLDRLSFTSRTIFHNTVYASVYETPELKNGYSLVIRQYLEISYAVDQRLNIQLADEPFFGVIEDREAPPSSIGFWPSGFRLNRIYAGFKFQVTPCLSLAPQYVYETAYNEGRVTDSNHYIFFTFSYVLIFS
jgi:hypothetical protein